MFLVDIQRDFNLSRFCTGNLVEVLKDIFTKETQKQSKEFQVHIEQIPVIGGKGRVA
jgi:hypothetical protein